MLVALLFMLARSVVKLVVERRRALPFARFRAKLVTMLLGDDAGAGRARAAGRQRTHQQQRGPLVQRADGGGAAVGPADRQRLLPRTPGAGDRRSRRASRSRLAASISPRRTSGGSRRRGARRQRAPGQPGRGLPPGSRAATGSPGVAAVVDTRVADRSGRARTARRPTGSPLRAARGPARLVGARAAAGEAAS